MELGCLHNRVHNVTTAPPLLIDGAAKPRIWAQRGDVPGSTFFSLRCWGQNFNHAKRRAKRRARPLRTHCTHCTHSLSHTHSDYAADRLPPIHSFDPPATDPAWQSIIFPSRLYPSAILLCSPPPSSSSIASHRPRRDDSPALIDPRPSSSSSSVCTAEKK